MNTPSPVHHPRHFLPEDQRQRRLLVAVGLVVIGVILLAAQLLQLTWLNLLILPLLGIGFIVWAFLERSTGLLVPGGILLGLGLGVAATTANLFQPGLPTVVPIMFGFGVSFLIPMFLSPFLGEKFSIWPIFPALVFFALGLIFMAGDQGLQLLITIGTYWPIILIVIGIVSIIVLLRRK